MFQGINSYSIYGPGVLNDTIVPGYGITKFPVNLHTFWSLPNGTTRNFGEATQYTTYPMGYPNWMYGLAQNFMSPNHISQWNPMLIGVMDFTNNNITNPFLTQMGNMQAYQWGANMMQNMQISSAIQQIAQTLNSMETSLTNCLKSDKLTAAQKATLQGLLEDVKALKEKIQKQLKDKNPTMEEVTEMQQEVLDLQKKISDEVDKIRTQLSESEDAGSAGSSSSSSSSSSSNNDVDLTGTDYENIDPETGKVAGSTTPSEAECEQFCAVIDTAISGPGTDEDTLQAALSGLNADNVVEIIKHWEETRGTHASNEGMIARILKDLNDGEQKEMVPLILNALVARAEGLGIYSEIKQELAKVNEQLKYERHCYWNMFGGQDDDVIKNNLMAIYNKIVKKEEANKKGAQAEIDKQNTEAEKKVSERRAQVEKDKKIEFANKMKEQLNLDETPQLAAGLKVETDDNGEFTNYSIELNTQNGKITVKGTTYQQLALEIEKNNLKVEDVLIRKTNA